MGFYAIAQSDALVDKEILISDDSKSHPYGIYKNERFYDLNGAEYKDKAQSLLEQVVAKNPQRKFSLTKDGELFGLSVPVPSINKQYTVIPRTITALSHDLLSDMPGLPQNSEIAAHGLLGEPVIFPVYINDPSAFLPDNLKAVTVKQAKNALRKHVYEWTEKGAPPAVSLPGDFHQLGAATRAEILVDFMKTYEKSPVMPAWINKTLKSTVNHPPNGMSESNFAMSLVGYLGHYAGDELEDAFLKSTLGSCREDRLHYSDVQSLTIAAGQVFNKQDKAIQTILSKQDEAQLSVGERIAELGVAMHQMGLDSDEVHTLAHRSGFEKAQLNQSPEPVLDRPKIA